MGTWWVCDDDCLVPCSSPGVYAMDWTEHYRGMLKNDEWITDIIPEIMNGKNIADFYDPNIEEKLAVLTVMDKMIVCRSWREKNWSCLLRMD